MTVLIAKNQTASALPVTQLPIPDNEIPGSGQVILTDFAEVVEIQESAEIRALIIAGSLLLSDGAADFSQQQSLNIVEADAFTTVNFRPSATDPAGVATPGDTYFNTALTREMVFDSSRAKWLSKDAWPPMFNHSQKPKESYLKAGELLLNDERGYLVSRNMTLCELSYTRVDEVDAPTFEVRVDGIAVASLASPANTPTGSKLDFNVDIAANAILQVYAAGDRASRPVVWLLLRWRV